MKNFMFLCFSTYSLLQKEEPGMIPKIIKRDCLPVICVIALMLIFLKAPTECHGFDIAIDVAPKTLNIQSEGTVVTVHTDILFDAVKASSVSLNSIPIQSYKEDNCGYFVAKFSMLEVKDLVDKVILKLGKITLTLKGIANGEEFTGSQVITVISIVPEGAGGQ
jgi:hypothetical protein